ncbi:MAG TPA: hypothetical protein PKW15_03570 [Alphaproteobacteria bacterium]|nr:hypothetical protein [Alphaproteobacteria bacterium]
MANLIITIISIALVAVAALMGAYYGGTAFMEGQAKARAVKVINDFAQIEGAIKLYGVNNAGTSVLPGAPFYNPVAGDWSVLIPTYMANEPTADEASGALVRYMCAKLASGGLGYDETLACSDTTNSVYDGSFLIAPVSEATCRAAVRMANNGAFTSFYDLSTGNIPALMDIGSANEKKFECAYLDDSSGGIIDGGEYYWLFYRWN